MAKYLIATIVLAIGVLAGILVAQTEISKTEGTKEKTAHFDTIIVQKLLVTDENRKASIMIQVDDDGSAALTILGMQYTSPEGAKSRESIEMRISSPEGSRTLLSRLNNDGTIETAGLIGLSRIDNLPSLDIGNHSLTKSELLGANLAERTAELDPEWVPRTLRQMLDYGKNKELYDNLPIHINKDLFIKKLHKLGQEGPYIHHEYAEEFRQLQFEIPDE